MQEKFQQIRRFLIFVSMFCILFESVLGDVGSTIQISESYPFFMFSLNSGSSLKFSYPGLMTFSLQANTTNQFFEMFSKILNLYRIVIPENTGRISVALSGNCLLPLAYATNNNVSIPVTNDTSANFSVTDFVNIDLPIPPKTIQVGGNISQLALFSFSYQNDQYFNQTTPSFLYIYCPFFADDSNKNMNATIDTSSRTSTTSFFYRNQFALINRFVTLKIDSQSVFRINFELSQNSVNFLFNNTQNSGLAFFIQELLNVTQPDANFEFFVNGTGSSALVIRNDNPSPVYLSLSTSKQGKPTGLNNGQIILIVVFSIVGALLFLVLLLFCIAYIKRKKPVEYPMAPDDLSYNNSEAFEKENYNPNTYDTEAGTFTNLDPTTGQTLGPGESPLVLPTGQHFPSLEEETIVTKNEVDVIITKSIIFHDKKK